MKISRKWLNDFFLHVFFKIFKIAFGLEISCIIWDITDFCKYDLERNVCNSCKKNVTASFNLKAFTFIRNHNGYFHSVLLKTDAEMIRMRVWMVTNVISK